MVVVPVATSVATPLVLLTVATPRLLLEYVMMPVPAPPDAVSATVAPTAPLRGPACPKPIVCGCGVLLPPPPPPPPPPHALARAMHAIAIMRRVIGNLRPQFSRERQRRVVVES